MSRPVFISNGSLMVGLDEFGMVHDFYYPYVGLENHAKTRGMHHRIGVYVDGTLHWLDSGDWDIKMDYEADAMVGTVTAHNETLQIGLEFHDFVDADYNVFGRNIHVINTGSTQRHVRIFMHQVFQISESTRGDTALYEPDENYILDYKGKRSFLIYGHSPSGESFDQYSIGLHGIEGKAGTYVDAEDGELSNHPVEHGMVDSTIRFALPLKPMSSSRLHYWVVAGATHSDVQKVHKVYLRDGLQARYEKTQKHWHEWFSPARKTMDSIDKKYITNVKKSLMIVKSHIDKRGSILASGDSEMLNYARDNYSYCWPRDAAYALWPLIRLGFKDEARAFFEFARDVLNDDGVLMHKFQPDRAVGSTWHPLIHKGRPELAIQEDETAIVIYMMHQYLQESNDEDFIRRFYTTFIQPAANFLETFIDESTKLPHASYDLWEEKFLTSTYTTAATYAGLRSAAKLAEHFEYPDDAIRWQTVADDIQNHAIDAFFNEEKEYFIKGFHIDEDGNKQIDDTIDTSSLYGAVMFQLIPAGHESVKRSLATLERELLGSAPIGGVPRYEFDRYCQSNPQHKGNPWFVTTLWLAQIYNELDRKSEAEELLAWVQSFTMKSGVLSEQIDPESGEFRSVAPLVWSQAELINTVLDITS